MANVQQVELKAGPPGAGFDKDGNEKDMIQYKNNLGICPSADSRHIGVSSQQVSSITKTSYCKIETASRNNYYNHSGIRAVHLNKAPWNDFYFSMTVVGLAVMIIGFNGSDEEATAAPLYNGTTPSTGTAEPGTNSLTFLGIVGVCVFSLFLAKLLYQYFHPTVFASVDTSRYGMTPCSWSNLSEDLVFIGKGPGVDIMSADDIGSGVLSFLQTETVLQRHQGRKLKGESTEIILTDKRISIRRTKKCCCNLILREDSLSSYKLEEIASATADQSFPLWWILATIWFVGVTIGYFVECSSENRQNDEAPCGPKKMHEWMNMMYIFWALSAIFFYLASNMAGGVGYCRRAFVTIHFNAPSYIPCFFTTRYELVELPKGVAQGRADKIARSVMAAQERNEKSKWFKSPSV